ncbi:MAG: response regulator [Nitriliruptor sp.]|nr:MAG: response regulator [Nitriliruptor sp.]
MVSGTDDTPGDEVAPPTVFRSFLEVAGNRRIVAVFAQGQLGRATAVRRFKLDRGHPLTQEWFLFVLTERFSAALFGRELRDQDPAEEMERLFASVWTFEPAVIVDLLRALQDVATSVSNDAATTVQSAVESFPPRAADPTVQQRFVNAVFERLEGGRRRWRTTSHQLLDARRAIEEQYRRLLDLERLAATGTVAASVAHDLNNPLGTIAMAATTLPSVDDPEERARLAGIVEREALRAGRITTDLLTFVSRRDPVRQAVANLLDNALAAPGRVGPVTISATCERRDLMLRIEDHGGSVTIDRTGTDGTVLVVQLPEVVVAAGSADGPVTGRDNTEVADGSGGGPQPTPPEADRTSSTAPAHGHVLVDDDDPAIRGLLEAPLRRDGWEVTSVERSVDALDAARGVSFDVALLDVGNGGWRLLDQLEEHQPGLRSCSVFLTGSPPLDGLLDGRPVLGKPFAWQDLAALLADISTTDKAASPT